MPLLIDYDERSPLGTDGMLKNHFPNIDGEFYLSKKFRKRMTNGEHVRTSVENIWVGGGEGGIVAHKQCVSYEY